MDRKRLVRRKNVTMEKEGQTHSRGLHTVTLWRGLRKLITLAMMLLVIIDNIYWESAP